MTTTSSAQIFDASDADFTTYTGRAMLRWRDLVSPTVEHLDWGSTRPNSHPDISCWINPDAPTTLQIHRNSTFWRDGFWTDGTTEYAPFDSGSVADVLDVVAAYAERARIGAVCAFVFEWQPHEVEDENGHQGIGVTVLSVWCGDTITPDEISAASAIDIPSGTRIRTGDTLSLPLGHRYGREDEILDKAYRFSLEQPRPGEWVVNSGPMSAGREVHAHGNGFATLADVIQWGRALWAASFDDDDSFDHGRYGRVVGVPVYRRRANERPAFRVYVY